MKNIFFSAVLCLFSTAAVSKSGNTITAIRDTYAHKCNDKKNDEQKVFCDIEFQAVFADLPKKMSPDLMLQIGWVYEALKYRLKEIDMTYANQAVLHGLVNQKSKGEIPVANSPMQKQMLQKYHGTANAIVQLAWVKREEENSNKQEGNLKNRYTSCPVINGDDCRQSINELITQERNKREGLNLMTQMLYESYPQLNHPKLKICISQAYSDGLDKTLQESDDPEKGLFQMDSNFATKVCYGNLNASLNDALDDSQKKLKEKRQYYQELVQDPKLLTYLAEPITSTAKSDLLELVTAFENKSIEGVDNILSFSKCAVTQKALAYEEMRTRNEIALGVASMLSTLGVGTMASLASAGAKVAAGAVNTSKISKLLGVTQLAVEALAAGEGLVQFSMSRDRCKRLEEEALIGGPAGRLHFEECRHEMETRGLFALLPLIRPALAAAKFAKGASAGSKVVQVAESIDAPPVIPRAPAPAAVPAPVKLAPLELPPPPARVNAPVDTAKLAPLELPPPPPRPTPSAATTAANTVDDIPVVTGRIIHPDVEDFAKLLPNDAAKFLARYADEFDAMAPALKNQLKEGVEMVMPPAKRAAFIKDFFNLPKGLRAQNITKFVSDKSFGDLKGIVELRKMMDEGKSKDEMIAFIKKSLSGKAQTRALEVLNSNGRIGALIPEFTQNSLVSMKNYLDSVGIASEIVPVGAKGPAHIKILGDKSTTRSYLTRYAKALKSSRDHDVVWEPMSEATGAKHGVFEAQHQKLVVPKSALDVGQDRFSADSILPHEGLHSQTAKFIKDKQNRPFLGNMSGDGLPPGPSVYQEGQHFDEIRTFTYEGKHHLKLAKRFSVAPKSAENTMLLDKETYSVMERSVASKILGERTLETVEMVKQAPNKTITFTNLNAQNYPTLVDGTQVVAAQVTVVKNGKTVSMTIPLVKSTGAADQAGNMALLNAQLDDLAKYSRDSIKSSSELIEQANALRVGGGLGQYDPNEIARLWIKGS